MADLSDDIRAAKIRHLGPCPKENGHAVESGFSAFIAGVFCSFLLVVGLQAAFSPNDREEAIKHGCATHNPVTGRFEWR